jgi:hypothetical protein
MNVDVSPPLERAERDALVVALARLGLPHADDPYRAAWRLAGLHEATDGDAADAGYAFSPRSTRGATRA